MNAKFLLDTLIIRKGRQAKRGGDVRVEQNIRVFWGAAVVSPQQWRPVPSVAKYSSACLPDCIWATLKK